MYRTNLLTLLVGMFYAALSFAQNGDIASKLGYPQMVLYNGKIVQMNDASFTSNYGGTVQAMAIRDGKILAMGTNAEIRPLAGPQTKTIDLKGRTVIPSLLMTHEHPTDWAFIEPRAFRHVLPDDSVIVSRWLPNVPPKQQLAMFEPTLKEALSKAKPGQWVRIIFNYGLDYEWAKELIPLFRKSVTREWLDQLAPNNPVTVKDGFINSIANTRAVEEFRSVHPDIAFYSTGRRGGAPSEEAMRRVAQSGNLGR